MGADLCLAITSFKNGARGQFKVFSDKEVDKIVDETKILKSDLDYMIDEGYIDSSSDMEDFIIHCKETAKEFFGCLSYRDVTTLNYIKGTIVLTGGMTHGDDPTESYRIIEDFNRLPDELLKKLNVVDDITTLGGRPSQPRRHA